MGIGLLAVITFWLVVAGVILAASARARVWTRRLPRRVRPGWASLYRHERWAMGALLLLVWIPVAIGVRRWSDNVPLMFFLLGMVIWTSDRHHPPSSGYLALRRRFLAWRHGPAAQRSG